LRTGRNQLHGTQIQILDWLERSDSSLALYIELWRKIYRRTLRHDFKRPSSG
jgi:hypothetical protein